MNKWKVMSHSQIGSSHLRNDKPNQDAFQYVNGDLVMAAVSDGHGSDAHKFSEIGSKLAVESAMTVIEKLLKSKEEIEKERFNFFEGHELSSESVQTWLCAYFSKLLPQQIVTLWKTKVLAHYESQIGLNDPTEDLNAIYKYYGCTLLTFFEFGNNLIFLQIGDGLIGIYENTGRLIQPIIEDKRHINNQTTSLADDYAEIEFKTGIYPLGDDLAFIAMTTDGVENAYPNHETDYIYFYHAIKGLILEGLDSIDYLLERTSRYSGDDSTAVIFYRTPPLFQPPKEDVPETTIVFRPVPEEYTPIEHALCESTSSHFMGIAAELCYAFETFERRDECVVILALQDIWVNRKDKKLLFMDRVLSPLTPKAKWQSRQLLAQLLYQIFYKSPPKAEGVLGLKIEPFKNAWLKGIEAPISPQVWSRIVDQIRQMAHFDYTKGKFVFEDRENDKDKDKDKESSPGVELVSQIGAYELFYDTILYLHQIMKLGKITNSIVGEIVTHPQNVKIWGIKNCSNHEWVQYMKGSDLPRYIPRGKVATIAEGSVIFMYGIPVTIKMHSKKAH